MGMPVARYLLIVLLPSVVFFVFSVVFAVTVDVPPLIRMPVPLLGTLFLVTAAIYPKLVVEQRHKGLENRLHLLVT